LNKGEEFFEIIDSAILAMPETKLERPVLSKFIKKTYPHTSRLHQRRKMLLMNYKSHKVS
jgi:hypothetical protein